MVLSLLQPFIPRSHTSTGRPDSEGQHTSMPLDWKSLITKRNPPYKKYLYMITYCCIIILWKQSHGFILSFYIQYFSTVSNRGTGSEMSPLPVASPSLLWKAMQSSGPNNIRLCVIMFNLSENLILVSLKTIHIQLLRDINNSIQIIAFQSQCKKAFRQVRQNPKQWDWYNGAWATWSTRFPLYWTWKSVDITLRLMWILTGYIKIN